MIGEADIKDLELRIGSAPAFNPMDKVRDEAQQINEWKQWSAQRLFLDKLQSTFTNRVRAAKEREAEAKRIEERASVAVRRTGLQIR